MSLNFFVRYGRILTIPLLKHFGNLHDDVVARYAFSFDLSSSEIDDDALPIRWPYIAITLSDIGATIDKMDYLMGYKYYGDEDTPNFDDFNYRQNNINFAINLPWGIDFIDKYGTLFNWRELSENEDLPWSFSLLKAFNFDEYEQSEDYKAELRGIHWHLEHLAVNKAIYNTFLKPLTKRELLVLLDEIRCNYSDENGQCLIPF